jgi:hypothetical protein
MTSVAVDDARPTLLPCPLTESSQLARQPGPNAIRSPIPSVDETLLVALPLGERRIATTSAFGTMVAVGATLRLFVDVDEGENRLRNAATQVIQDPGFRGSVEPAGRHGPRC